MLTISTPNCIWISYAAWCIIFYEKRLSVVPRGIIGGRGCINQTAQHHWNDQSLLRKPSFAVGDGAVLLSAEIQRCVEQICSEDRALIRSFTSPSDRQQQQLYETLLGPQKSFINSLFFRNYCRRSHFSFREADLGSSGTNVGIN